MLNKFWVTLIFIFVLNIDFMAKLQMLGTLMYLFYTDHELQVDFNEIYGLFCKLTRTKGYR